MTSLSTFESWSVVFGLALGTFLIRYSFIGLFAECDLPPWLERALQLMVPAIFAAIVFSSIAIVNAPLGAELAGWAYWPRYAAAVIAFFAAVMSRGSMLVTLAVGMAALHGLPWLFG